MSELKLYTADEVNEHNSSGDVWVVIDGLVYDVSKYVDEHPGGEEVILDVAGQDATEAFEDIGHSDDARSILKGYLIGKLEGSIEKNVKSKSSEEVSDSTSLPLIAAVILLVAVGAYYYLNQ